MHPYRVTPHYFKGYERKTFVFLNFIIFNGTICRQINTYGINKTSLEYYNTRIQKYLLWTEWFVEEMSESPLPVDGYSTVRSLIRKLVETVIIHTSSFLILYFLYRLHVLCRQPVVIAVVTLRSRTRQASTKVIIIRSVQPFLVFKIIVKVEGEMFSNT